MFHSSFSCFYLIARSTFFFFFFIFLFIFFYLSNIPGIGFYWFTMKCNSLLTLFNFSIISLLMLKTLKLCVKFSQVTLRSCSIFFSNLYSVLGFRVTTYFSFTLTGTFIRKFLFKLNVISFFHVTTHDCLERVGLYDYTFSNNY